MIHRVAVLTVTLLFASLLSSSAQAPPAPDDDHLWTDFVTWLATAPRTTQVASYLDLYARHLVETGTAPPMVPPTMARVLALMRDRPEAWRLIFDRLYTTPGATFRTEPTALVVSAIEGRQPGRALDVGMGQGRNAVFLALKGWDVTGIDLSEEGLAAARGQATRGGVSLHALREDASTFDYGDARWDLIVITYGPALVGDAPFATRVKRSLKPGGLLVIETFASDRTAALRKPVDLDPAELLHVYGDDLRIVRFEDVDGTSEWDPQVTRLVRMVGQKRQ